jgi:hypothetical protein
MDFWTLRQREQAAAENTPLAPILISSEEWARVRFHLIRQRKYFNRREAKGKKRLEPGHPIWDLQYAIGRLLCDSRDTFFSQPFYEAVEAFFCPANAKERAACNSIAWKLLWEPLGRNFFEDDETDERCAEIIANAKAKLADGTWKRISIGPKSTPLLHAMRNRAAAAEAMPARLN